MTLDEETLIAYVDGELEGEARAAVERAMAADPDIARRIERHRALQQALHAAYDPVLEEPVPDRLIAAARTAASETPGADVIPLHATRSARARRWSAREWMAIAASLIVGALTSALLLRTFGSAPLVARDGSLIARGVLASALSMQLASDQPPDAPVAIGLSFVAKSGRYCRTFTLRGNSALAGLACRNGGRWQIDALARSAPSAPAGTYRQAASSIPQPILDAASSQMAGSPLDARAEAAARARGWTR